MWVKRLDAEELGMSFMPRTMDPLDNKQNKYDNMVEDEEEFEEQEVEIRPLPGALSSVVTATVE